MVSLFPVLQAVAISQSRKSTMAGASLHCFMAVIVASLFYCCSGQADPPPVMQFHMEDRQYDIPTVPPPHPSGGNSSSMSMMSLGMNGIFPGLTVSRESSLFQYKLNIFFQKNKEIMVYLGACTSDDKRKRLCLV